MNEKNTGQSDDNEKLTKRDQFLFHMYNQMFNDINIHLTAIWHCVAVLAGTVAVFIIFKDDVSLDIASVIIILAATWLICHALNGGYWYNRNLVIIANIERMFLYKSDLHNIHYYFGDHREKSSLLTHFGLQVFFGFGIIILALLNHVIFRLSPGFNAPYSNFEWVRAIPYISLLIPIFCIPIFKKYLFDKYVQFIKNSPGIKIDTSGVEFGTGHPIAKKIRK